jgi:hypothetical protein
VAAAAVAFDADGVSSGVRLPSTQRRASLFLTIELNARQTLLSNYSAGPNTASSKFFSPLSMICWAAGPNPNR